MTNRIFITALALATFVRLAINAFVPQDLFGDEAQYWYWSQNLAFGYFSKPPFIAWGMAGFQQLCGQSEFCLRLPAVLAHSAIALIIWRIGLRISPYAPKVGLWAGLIYLASPGAIFSSILINTDVFLLLFWALALYALLRLSDLRDWRSAVLLGLALGCGLLSKYAMLFFLVGLLPALALLKAHRPLLVSAKLYAAFLIAGLLLLPNILWNAQLGWITVEHTGSSAGWSLSDLFAATDWRDPAEFLGGQVLLFGPLAWLGVLLASRRSARSNLTAGSLALILFVSLPILVIYTGQSVLSRAFLNWAAASYIGLSLVAAIGVVGRPRLGWLHLFLGAVMQLSLAAVLTLHATSSPLVDTRLLQRVKNWDSALSALAPAITASGARTLVHSDRLTFGEASYYLRDLALDHRMIPAEGPVNNHYNLVAELAPQAVPSRLLFLSNRPIEQSPLPSHPGMTVLANAQRGVIKQRRNAFYLYLLSATVNND